MKRRSKIFLIVAGALMALGAIICLVGAGVASAAGDQLFAEKTEAGRVYTYDFDDSDIQKITLQVTDADISIIGGAEKSYIEIINFNENFYTYSASNKNITFREADSLKGIANFWEGGFSFKGMRYLFRFAGGNNAKKKVNIYLSTNEQVTCFDLKAESGTIQISNIDTASDYLISVARGVVNINGIKTESTVSVTSTDSDVGIKNCAVHSLQIKSDAADIKAVDLTLYQGSITVGTGSADLSFAMSSLPYDLQVKTVGKLTVNGEHLLDVYKYSSDKKTAADTEPANGTNSETEAEPARASLVIKGGDLSVTLTDGSTSPTNSSETTSEG